MSLVEENQHSFAQHVDELFIGLSNASRQNHDIRIRHADGGNTVNIEFWDDDKFIARRTFWKSDVEALLAMGERLVEIAESIRKDVDKQAQADLNDDLFDGEVGDSEAEPF